jgi:hypothetical protein
MKKSDDRSVFGRFPLLTGGNSIHRLELLRCVVGRDNLAGVFNRGDIRSVRLSVRIVGTAERWQSPVECT